MKSIVRNYRQSPRKVRLVADAVRGKRVQEALTVLRFMPKRATRVIQGAIMSAMANAQHNFKVESDNLFVSGISVDKGLILKRSQPRSKGMATPIHKHSSHISVTLGIVQK